MGELGLWKVFLTLCVYQWLMECNSYRDWRSGLSNYRVELQMVAVAEVTH